MSRRFLRFYGAGKSVTYRLPWPNADGAPPTAWVPIGTLNRGQRDKRARVTVADGEGGEMVVTFTVGLAGKPRKSRGAKK